MKSFIRNKMVPVLLLVLAGGLTGCASEAAAPTIASPITVVTTAEADHLVFLREEEKLARDVYLDLAEYWSGLPDGATAASVMAQIASSEQRHMDRIKSLLAAYGLSDPVDPAETRGRFANPELAGLYTDLTAKGRSGLLEAWTVGATIEDKDIYDLQAAAPFVTQDAARIAFDALTCGSRNHLRSFNRQLTAAGATYVAVFLPRPRWTPLSPRPASAAAATRPERRKGGRACPSPFPAQYFGLAPTLKRKKAYSSAVDLDGLGHVARAVAGARLDPDEDGVGARLCFSCSVATNLNEWAGTTRSSWSAVVTSVAG